MANWHFIRESTDYFASDVGRSPVLHVWSLAVEEQFYVLWPLLLTGLVWAAGRFGERRRLVLQVAVAAGALASAGWALALRADRPERLLRHRHPGLPAARRRCSPSRRRSWPGSAAGAGHRPRSCPPACSASWPSRWPSTGSIPSSAGSPSPSWPWC
ncbi:MAG: hypothetical protein R2746_08325 [Acidimicrobiales bacterium]